MNEKIRKITAETVVADRVNGFKIGDSVRVHIRIREGEKERIQIFSGIILARKGTGATETFTVRRISFGEGVEKIFPIHSPYIERIEVERSSVTMRAKLYYLRDRIGKKAMKVKENQRDLVKPKRAG
jgi:large subunit ribosomal protein L19